MIPKNLIKCKKEFEHNINLLANHLLVILAFISTMNFNRAVSAILFSLTILFLVRGNYIFYLKEAISNKIIQALILFVIVHFLWLFGSDNLNEANNNLYDLKYYLYSILICSFVDKKFIRIIISSFVFGMMFSEIISYLIHFDIIPHRISIFNILIYSTPSQDNPTPFLNHVHYNTFLSISIGVLLYNLLSNKNNLFIKFISICFIVTASVNLTLVGGRTGYLVYIVVIFVTLILVYKKSFLKLPLFIGVFY